MDLVSYLASRYFPLRGYGGVFGLLYAAFQIGVAISPPAYGAIFDNFHDYAPAFLGAGACLGLAASAFHRLPAIPQVAAPSA
jgi:MFS family permease